MIRAIIGANPGFLLSTLEYSNVYPDDKFFIIFKEELPGGSWKFNTKENDTYYANHFFCSNKERKIKKFIELNLKYFDMKLNEIEDKYIYVPNTKYIDYKFYTFNKPVPFWINKIYEQIIKKDNITLLNNSLIKNLRILNNKITIEFLDKNNILNKLDCDKIYFTRNTLFDKIFVNDDIFYPKIHKANYIHEFFKINIIPKFHLVINSK